MTIFKRMNYSRLVFYNRLYKQCMSTKPKIIAELNHEINKSLEDNEYKPRKHPGRFKMPCSQIPENIVNSVLNIVKDMPVKAIVEDAKLLSRYLFSRCPPVEQIDIEEKRSKIQQKVKSKYTFDAKTLTEDQRDHFRKVINNQVDTILQKELYHWQKLDLNEYACLVYLFGRASQNYAVINRIFNEIIIRCPDFKPSTLFDFGSGIGTVSWVAESLWKDSLNEYFCVDSSPIMNDLASLIIRGGDTQAIIPKGVFYRQFLPSQNRPYNLVVSAFTLFELPSNTTRLDVLLNLWQKTEDFLVVVEQGSWPGYKLVLEARDFILSLKNQKENLEGHVFAPCTHEFDCPIFVSGDQNQCNFLVSYNVFPIGQRNVVKKESFSYVILRKGARHKDDPQWPRLVRPVLKKSKHSICRMCTNSGQLQEVIFTASKHGKTTYHCARSSQLGDLLPVTLTEQETDSS